MIGNTMDDEYVIEPYREPLSVRAEAKTKVLGSLQFISDCITNDLPINISGEAPSADSLEDLNRYIGGIKSNWEDPGIEE